MSSSWFLDLTVGDTEKPEPWSCPASVEESNQKRGRDGNLPTQAVTQSARRRTFFFRQAADFSNVSDQKVHQSQMKLLYLFQRKGGLNQRLFDHQQRNQTGILPGRLHDQLKDADGQRTQ